MSKQQKQRQ